MSVKTFLTIMSIVGLAFGFGNLLFPAQMGALYGMEPARGAEFMARYFGVALLAWATISWFAREFHDESDLRHVLAPSGVAFVAGLIVSTMGTLSGVTNALGWLSAAIFLVGALGSFYFLSASTRHGLIHT